MDKTPWLSLKSEKLIDSLAMADRSWMQLGAENNMVAAARVV
jgi:hypothetical protein